VRRRMARKAVPKMIRRYMSETAVRGSLKRWGEKRGWEILKAEGLAVGFPDEMILIPGGRVIFVELKAADGRVAPSQKEWADKLSERGFNVCTVWGAQGLAEFKERWK